MGQRTPKPPDMPHARPGAKLHKTDELIKLGPKLGIKKGARPAETSWTLHIGHEFTPRPAPHASQLGAMRRQAVPWLQLLTMQRPRQLVRRCSSLTTTKLDPQNESRTNYILGVARGHECVLSRAKVADFQRTAYVGPCSNLPRPDPYLGVGA